MVKTSIVFELTIEEKQVCKQRYYFQMEIISNKHHLTLISLVHLFTYLLFPYILNSYFLLSENISDSRLENISKTPLRSNLTIS